MNNALQQSLDIFYHKHGLELSQVESIVNDALQHSDDGELYFQSVISDGIVFDDGRVKNASYNQNQGFGMRCVVDDITGYAHSKEFSTDALKRAATTVKTVYNGQSTHQSLDPVLTNHQFYQDENPVSMISFDDKLSLMQQIDAYARSLDPRIVQVSASMGCSWEIIEILRKGGLRLSDIRPLLRLNVSVVAQQGDRQESGSHGAGGRGDFLNYTHEEQWKFQAKQAVEQALRNLEAQPSPAGEMTVVLGAGWPGVLLHEAVGHGLEGDFNRKETSAFAGLVGERVASPGVTIVDDGTIDGRRGSLNIDDEGTPSDYNVLIEDGILKGFMQDRMNARLMKKKATGNGRRQSFAHQPMPRMTNTYMLSGNKDPQEIIASIDDGVYAVNFGGGQVDITNGKYVFSCTEAYKVEKGEIKYPLKGATLIGNGPNDLTKVTMIGNDSKLDDGVGTCGKSGQQVPVGVGQPTMRIENMTVGGTA